jgi:hypothetical protein
MRWSERVPAQSAACVAEVESLNLLSLPMQHVVYRRRGNAPPVTPRCQVGKRAKAAARLTGSTRLAKSNAVARVRTDHRIPAARTRPSDASTLSLEKGGRRECRVFVAPAASRAKVKKHTSIVTTGTPNLPALPAQRFYGLFRALPGVPGLIASIPSRLVSPKG